MSMPLIKVDGAKCKECGHKWILRVKRKFIICPKCKTVEVV